MTFWIATLSKLCKSVALGTALLALVPACLQPRPADFVALVQRAALPGAVATVFRAEEGRWPATVGELAAFGERRDLRIDPAGYTTFTLVEQGDGGALLRLRRDGTDLRMNLPPVRPGLITAAHVETLRECLKPEATEDTFHRFDEVWSRLETDARAKVPGPQTRPATEAVEPPRSPGDASE